jgi:4-amino-4-deoxy-L-arabinose transferase-like glycosyltransferase
MDKGRTQKPPTAHPRNLLDASTLILIPILLGGAALRFFTLKHESLWFDELYVVWARRMPFREIIPEIFSSEHPPVFNIIGYFWEVLGHNEFWVRSLSAAIGTITIFAVYLTGKELISRRVGLWAAAFAAVSPMLVWYSREATSYAWVILISLASFYMLVRSCRRGGWVNWSGYTVVTIIAVFSHMSSLVLVIASAAVVPLLCSREEGRWKPWLATQAFILPALAALLALGTHYGSPLDIANPVALDTVMIFLRGIARAPSVLLMGYTGYIIEDPSSVAVLGRGLAIAWALVLVILVVLFASRRVRQAFITRETGALALFSFLLVAGPVALLLFRSNETAGRYYVWAVPALLILLAAIIAAAPRKIGTAAGAIMVAGLLLTTTHELSIFNNENWGGLMSVVRENRQEGDSVNGGFLDFTSLDGAFFGPEGEPWDGYRDAYLVDGEQPRELKGGELKDRLQRDLDGKDRLWLVAGNNTVAFYPSAEIVEEALPPGWNVVETHNFPRLVLKLYER